MTISLYLLTVATLLLISVFSSKLGSRWGIPALLIFLGVGMLFGSDGLNLVYFDDYGIAQSFGIIALIYILFSGGLDTHWKKIRPIIAPGISLSTLGVLFSAFTVGGFAIWILNFSILEGVLLGAIVSSTDAAAVFSILRSKDIGFKYRLKEMMEFESGTNDPMAIFLTLGVIQWLTLPAYGFSDLIILFLLQISIGLVAGFLFGRTVTWLINNINLDYDGLYPVLTLALVPLIYSATDLLGGSGFLAVYLAGLILGNSNFIHQRSLVNFFDGIGWLMQIAMFLTLGLLVFPNQILEIWIEGLVIAGVLIFLARPISVFLSLMFSNQKTRGKLMISWAGLRGAVPIIMATFPLVAGIPNAELIFSIVFFVVVTSVIIQGPTISWVAKKTKFPVEFEPSVDTKSAMKELEVEATDPIVGRQVIDLNFPENSLIVIINREGKFLIPRGTTVIQTGDKLLILAQKKSMLDIRKIIKGNQIVK